MKKIIILILAAILCVPAIEANTNKELQKALKKEYKEKKKEFKKGKWEIFGSSRSLDVALLSHYEKLNSLGENGREVVGIASRFKSKNVGHQMAINNACLTYAQQAGSHLKGRIVSDMAGNGDDSSAEFDHFYAAYERLVEKEIKGEMKKVVELGLYAKGILGWYVPTMLDIRKMPVNDNLDIPKGDDLDKEEQMVDILDQFMSGKGE